MSLGAEPGTVFNAFIIVTIARSAFSVSVVFNNEVSVLLRMYICFCFDMPSFMMIDTMSSTLSFSIEPAVKRTCNAAGGGTHLWKRSFWQ